MERMPSAATYEGETDIAKLENFIGESAERYRDEGVPISSDGRIDMTEFRELHLDVEKDLSRNRDWEKDWFDNASDVAIAEKRRHMEGEQLEMLAYAIFTKSLGEDFVVARTSPHDDRVNKVDTIILDRKTGDLVCAFDEVGDASGSNFEKKQALVRDRNLDGGTSLKYGLGIHSEKGKENVVVPSEATHLPLFYIAVPKNRIKEGMKEFVADPVQQSEFEKNMFTYFLATIGAQIGNLEVYQKRLHPELKKKMDNFKKIVASLKPQATKKS